MYRGFLVSIIFMSIFWSVFAQGGFDGSGSVAVATTTSNSPVPIGGFVSFDLSCASGVFTRGLVCDSPSCNFSTPPICLSNFSSLGSHACAYPTTPNDWGFHFQISSACCDTAGACGLIAKTNPWLVGVTPHSTITSMSSSLSRDPRGIVLVQRTPARWVGVFDSPQGASIVSTTNSGFTWSTPILIKSLFSQGLLPSGVLLSNVQVVNPVVAMGPSSVVVAVEVFDASSSPRKSNIYFLECASTSCTSASSWSVPTPILDPLVTESNPGGANSVWRYAFAAPKMVVTNSGWAHVVFDDSTTDPALRIQGIFHRYCSLPGGCDSSDAWSSSPSGVDLLNDTHNGYPRSPHVSVNSAGLFVTWVDYASSGNPSSDAVMVAHYRDDLSSWSTPSVVGSGAPSVLPWISASNNRVLLSVLRGGVPIIWECDAGCLAVPGTPVDWDDVSSSFAGLLNLSSVSEVLAIVSPFDSSDAVALSTGQLSGNRQLFGVYSRNGSSTSLRRLSTSNLSFSLKGVSDLAGANWWGVPRSLQWAGSTASGGEFYSSGIFAGTNVSPLLNVTSPVAPTSWTTTSLSPYNQPVSFTVQDSDSGDGLYASVYFGLSPGERTYVLRDWVDLRADINGSPDSCTGTTFVTQQSCTLNLPLYSPATSVLAPNGNYFVVVVLRDSFGNEVSDSTSGPVTFSLPHGNMTIFSPLSNAFWTGPTVRQLRVGMSQPLFAQTLDVRFSGTSAGSTFTWPVLPVAAYGNVFSPCTQTGADYNCTFSIVPTSSIAEGVYSLDVSSRADGVTGLARTVANVTIDFVGPRFQSFSPQGTVSTRPSAVSFSLVDFSPVPAAPLVQINGQSVSPSCTFTPTGASCSAGLPSGVVSGPVTVNVAAVDAPGNSSSLAFSFTVEGNSPPTTGSTTGGGDSGGSGSGSGGGPGKIIPRVEDVITHDNEGNVLVNGTPVVIPRTIVETVGSFSKNVVTATSNLVDVVGPSAHAIFLGLCVIAGLASDVVFRRVFSKIRADTYKQRERLVRALLAGIFFIIPLTVGWSFSLVAGFIFTVMEIVGFVAAAYAIKILQYYDTFGYKTIQGVASAMTPPPRPPLM